MRANTPQTFWKQVAISAPDACWLWRGNRDEHGYGILAWQGKKRRAHRVAFFLATGAWPRPCGLHACDTRACCNPRHIHAGTVADNNRQRAERGRNADQHGNRSPRAILRESDIPIIRLLCGRIGCTHREVAARYGVARQTITNVMTGHHWKSTLEEANRRNAQEGRL